MINNSINECKWLPVFSPKASMVSLCIVTFRLRVCVRPSFDGLGLILSHTDDRKLILFYFSFDKFLSDQGQTLCCRYIHGHDYTHYKCFSWLYLCALFMGTYWFFSGLDKTSKLRLAFGCVFLITFYTDNHSWAQTFTVVWVTSFSVSWSQFSTAKTKSCVSWQHLIEWNTDFEWVWQVWHTSIQTAVV